MQRQRGLARPQPPEPDSEPEQPEEHPPAPQCLQWILPGLENPGSETGELAYRISYRKSRFSVEFKALGPRDAARNHTIRPRECVFHVMKNILLGFFFTKKYFSAPWRVLKLHENQENR